MDIIKSDLVYSHIAQASWDERGLHPFQEGAQASISRLNFLPFGAVYYLK